MLDKHIDRSDVKALQGVQLTDTNFLIDFIHLKILSSNSMRICNLKKRTLFKKRLRSILLRVLIYSTRSTTEVSGY